MLFSIINEITTVGSHLLVKNGKTCIDRATMFTIANMVVPLEHWWLNNA